MYNRILKRPMFRRGGPSFQAQGTGITSPYDTPRTIGGGVIRGNPMGNRTGFQDPDTIEQINIEREKIFETPKGQWLSDVIGSFGAYGAPYKESGEAKTIGEMGYEQAQGIKEIRDARKEKQDLATLSGLESREAKLIRGEEMAQAWKIAQLKAKGEKEFIVEQINSYWDPLILAETDAKKKKDLEDQKRSDTYNVIVLGEDISDKYKILTNEAAYSLAVGNAEEEIKTTVNPTTKVNWTTQDTGYNEALQRLINKYLRLATKFLDPDKKASGGRVGKALGGGMTEDINIKTQTPDGTSDINVSETVEKVPEETNAINISYEQLRNRLPPEIKDSIVLLLSQSYEAFADFAEIQTQADVNEFNIKYNVQLFLPQQTGV
jgi:hypothetical protein